MQITGIRMEKKDKFYSTLRQAGIYTAIPFLLALGPIIGLFIGKFLDGKLNTEPFLTILFLVFGFIASGKEVYNLVKRAMKDTEKENKNNRMKN